MISSSYIMTPFNILMLPVVNKQDTAIAIIIFFINTFPPLSKTDKHYRIPTGKIMWALAHLGIWGNEMSDNIKRSYETSPTRSVKQSLNDVFQKRKTDFIKQKKKKKKKR